MDKILKIIPYSYNGKNYEIKVTQIVNGISISAFLNGKPSNNNTYILQNNEFIGIDISMSNLEVLPSERLIQILKDDIKNGYGIPSNAKAQTILEEDNFTDPKLFKFDKFNGSITKYSDRGPKDVAIPSVINGITVTSIGKNAFYDRQTEKGKGITSVVIPNTVVSIEENAFHSNRLTSLVIPEGVTTIGKGAFMINQLTSITIPESVTTIGESAFMINQLASITIPESVTYIRYNVFSSNELTSITIGENVSLDNFSFGNGFEKSYNEGGKLAGTYTRPDTDSKIWVKK